MIEGEFQSLNINIVRSHTGSILAFDSKYLAGKNIDHLVLGTFHGNKIISDQFFRSVKIIRACNRNGSPLPIIHTDANRSFFLFELNIHQEFLELRKQATDQVQETGMNELNDHIVSETGKVTDQVTDQVQETGIHRLKGNIASGNSQTTDQVTDQVQKMILLLKNTSLSRKEIMERLNLVHTHSFRELYLLPSMEAGFVVMTIPDKPNSNKQKYKLSPLGLKTLSNLNDKSLTESEKT